MYYLDTAVKDLESDQAPVSLCQIISNLVTSVFTERQRKHQSEKNGTFHTLQAFFSDDLWNLNFYKTTFYDFLFQI